jgi:hypothetical protein
MTRHTVLRHALAVLANARGERIEHALIGIGAAWVAVTVCAYVPDTGCWPLVSGWALLAALLVVAAWYLSPVQRRRRAVAAERRPADLRALAASLDDTDDDFAGRSAPMTSTNDESTATAGLVALQALITGGDWLPLSGMTSVLAFLHLWPDGSADMLAVYSETDAHAERTDPTGLLVWRARTTLVDVITAVRELPSPDAPSAPPICHPSRFRYRPQHVTGDKS